MADTEEELSYPFIGDLYDINSGSFLPSQVNGNFSVRSIKIDGSCYEFQVALEGSLGKSDSGNATHVVVGITVELEEDNTTHTILITSGNQDNMVSLPVNIPISQTHVLIDYQIAPFADIGLVFVANASTQLQMSDIQNLPVSQRLVAALEQLKQCLQLPLSQEDERELMARQKEFASLFRTFILKVFNLLLVINTTNWRHNVFTVVSELTLCQRKAEEVYNQLAVIENEQKGKSALINSFAKCGVQFVRNDKEFATLLRSDKEDVYVIFYSKELSADVKLTQETFKFYFDFVKDAATTDYNLKAAFAAVDLNMLSHTKLGILPCSKVVVRHYSAGQWVSQDMVRDCTTLGNLNIATCNVRMVEGKPAQRAKLEMPCPLSFTGRCKNEPLNWTCSTCNDYLIYGFDRRLYCSCGGAKQEEFRFKCRDYKHGKVSTQLTKASEPYLKLLKPVKQLNILILGQSGVGKSTWINGIVNYITYDSLDVAKKSDVLSPIPTKFTVTDNRYQTREIMCGADENEDVTVGNSATQECRTYNLFYKKYFVQLIDTPGLSDVRGIMQDRENVKKILEHIRYYDSLHGICILLKPNESRLSVLLSFCVKEILAHLHKNSSRNIVYCFTNSRATFYKPGDTLPVLEKLLEDINVQHSLSKETIFCMDNEAYRYLCTFNMPGITYTKDEDESFSLSWNRSVEETKRLLDHVASIPPHETKETLTLNQAKRTILSLTKPIAEITHNIEVNIAAVEDHRNTIENWKRDDKELMKNLFVPFVMLEHETLPHPRTVCVSSRCVDYHTLPNSQTQVAEYKTHCHPHCYLQNIQPESFPNEGLKHCSAMGEALNCHYCSCSWAKHMHIYYEQRRTEVSIKNNALNRQVNNRDDACKAKEQAIADLNDRVHLLEDEKTKIINITANFGQFLKKNAITPYNDAFIDYLELLIDQEESKPNKFRNDMSLLNQLKKTKAIYQLEVETLDRAMQSKSNVVYCSPTDVYKWQKELYELPIHGQQLRKLMESTMAGEEMESRQNGTPVNKGVWKNITSMAARFLPPWSTTKEDEGWTVPTNHGRGRGRGRGAYQQNSYQGRGYMNQQNDNSYQGRGNNNQQNDNSYQGRGNNNQQNDNSYQGRGNNNQQNDNSYQGRGRGNNNQNKRNNNKRKNHRFSVGN